MQEQFGSFGASELYCPRCRATRPVRERLLLVLPRGELHEYRCTVCGESLATRTVALPAALSVPSTPPSPHRRNVRGG